MMFSALLVMMATSAATNLPLLPEAESFAVEATGWLLQGDELPRDYRVRLMRMPPDARLQALAFLRRAGLLTGESWSLQDILRSAIDDGEARK